MKVIDLLNMIAKGEIPKKIKYKYIKYNFDDGIYIKEIIADLLFECSYNLTDEVEIIEDTSKEKKKIEELSTWYAISEQPTLDGLCKYLDYNNEQFYNKINELVRKVNGE